MRVKPQYTQQTLAKLAKLTWYSLSQNILWKGGVRKPVLPTPPSWIWKRALVDQPLEQQQRRMKIHYYSYQCKYYLLLSSSLLFLSIIIITLFLKHALVDSHLEQQQEIVCTVLTFLTEKLIQEPQHVSFSIPYRPRRIERTRVLLFVTP